MKNDRGGGHMAIVRARGTPKKGQNRKLKNRGHTPFYLGGARTWCARAKMRVVSYCGECTQKGAQDKNFCFRFCFLLFCFRFHFCFCFSASASASLLLLLLFFISLFLAFPLPLFCFLTRACPTRRLVLPVPRLALRPERPHHEGPRTREHGGAQYPRVPLCIGTII